MEQDSLLQFKPPLCDREGKSEIWDGIRKKWVAATPEEFIRQKMIAWLVCQAMIPITRISVERAIPSISARWDIAVHDSYGKPVLLAECKSQLENIKLEGIFQAAHYAQALPSVNWIWVSNGTWLHWLQRNTTQDLWQHSNERAFLSYSKSNF